jgi:hypothetical protein
VAEDLVYRLRKRAEIRRQIATRKSVQNNEPDRLADLLEEAANVIVAYRDAGDRCVCGHARENHYHLCSNVRLDACAGAVGCSCGGFSQ